MSRVVRAAALALLLGLGACEGDKPKVQPPPSAGVPSAPSGSAASLFAAVHRPTSGTAEVFGSYTRGCIAGAQQLSLDAPRWQVLHPSRNRAWGHPKLIKVVGEIADGVASDGHRGLLIGDLGQPRGGPSPSDHNSHQVGLDVDIWLTPMPARKLDPDELDNYEPPSMVDLNPLSINARFGDAQFSMLMHAAKQPEVERIFVSPPIKRALCQRASGDRDWLQKVRPWRGHMSHMHVRIACPIDSDDCKAQEAPPDGDGCGAELQSWFSDRSWMRDAPGRYVPSAPMGLDALPAACRRVLTERG